MSKILFWQGRGQSDTVLSEFLRILRADNEVVIFPFKYDNGSLPFSSESEWSRWLCSNKFDWWCGISLGASLAHRMTEFCGTYAPERLTLINPFHSRRQLANEKLFSMDGQWDFTLSENIGAVKMLEVVVSVYDDKIPLHHSMQIMSQTITNSKQLIFVNSDHCISEQYIQSELAEMLLKENYEKKQFKTSQYCHIYKPC